MELPLGTDPKSWHKVTMKRGGSVNTDLWSLCSQPVVAHVSDGQLYA